MNCSEYFLFISHFFFLAGISCLPIFFICIFAYSKLEKQIEIYHEKNFIYPTDVFADN